MSRKKQILTYAVTIAVIMVIAALSAFFIRRSMRDTVNIRDYALSLGSDELFVNENANIYRLTQNADKGYVYVKRIRHDNGVTFSEEFRFTDASDLSPVEFAATSYSGLLYVRGDGSVWRKDDTVTSGADHYIRLRPFFDQCSSEELKPEEGCEILSVSRDARGYNYYFDLDLAEDWELSSPEIRLSVKLNDGNWHRLTYHGSYEYAAASPLGNAKNHISVRIPTIPDTVSCIPGHYRIEVYENLEFYTSLVVEMTADDGVAAVMPDSAYCEVS